MAFFMICMYVQLVVYLWSMLIAGSGADKIDMGVVLGTDSNQLPSPAEIVELYKKFNIGKIRLLAPDSSILDALRNSDIDVTVSVPNEEITLLSNDQNDAELWFQNNLAPYIPSVSIAYISVGSDAIPGPYAANITSAMWFLRRVLRNHDLNAITVTTIVSTRVLQNMYPPSQATFTDESRKTMVDVFNFLTGKNASPILMINIYPYYNYSADPDNIGLDFAQSTATQPKFVDKNNLTYYSLFDSMVDAFFWSMEKVNVYDTVVAVAESGWPWCEGDETTSPMLAAAYNKRYMERTLSHVGTPKRPGLYIEGFIYGTYNENLKKPNGIKQCFGLFSTQSLDSNYDLFPQNPS